MSYKDRRKYDGDVFYAVWRGGGNPDHIDTDRVRDAYYEHITAEDFAASEVRRQQSKPTPLEEMPLQ